MNLVLQQYLFSFRIKRSAYNLSVSYLYRASICDAAFSKYGQIRKNKTLIAVGVAVGVLGT